METTSDLVNIGKIIDEQSYSREKKQILIDDKINIDFLEDWKVIHEVKKSDKLEKASIWQVKYYIYTLREKGVNIEKGILDYPSLRRRTEVLFCQEDRELMRIKLEEIERVIESEHPVKVDKKPYCSKCSYHDMCYL